MRLLFSRRCPSTFPLRSDMGSDIELESATNALEDEADGGGGGAGDDDEEGEYPTSLIA